jgi:hypothetical protein
LQLELSADAISEETSVESLEATTYAVERQPSFTTQQSESCAHRIGSTAYPLASARGSLLQPQAAAIEAAMNVATADRLIFSPPYFRVSQYPDPPEYVTPCR